MRLSPEAKATFGVPFVFLAVGGVAVLTAAILTGSIRSPAPLNLPPELIVLALVAGMAAPLLVTRWRATFWCLFAWLIVEDLIRKYLGNDLRVYFLKDCLYILLLIGLALDRDVVGAWRSATGAVRFRLYAIVAWTIVLTVPTLLVNWQIPLVGLKLAWEFIPLLTAAFVFARQKDGVRRLLTGFVALGIPACLAGIAQGYLGTGFLQPAAATPNLSLTFDRAFDIVQPSGLFVSPGRFANMALLTFVLSLALLVLTFRVSRWRFRMFALAGAVVSAVAVWVEVSKTSIVVAALLTVVAACAPAFAERRPAVLRAVATFALVSLTLIAAFALLPQQSTNRVSYLTSALDPSQSTNQWAGRFASWEDNTWRGIQIGGMLGAGTGAGSLGLQYVVGSATAQSVANVGQVEGGFAAVAQQWGVIGLVLWLVWSVSWVARGWRSIVRARGSQLAGAGLILLSWMALLLFVGFVQGFQGFQDYYANAYFWIVSGMLFALPWCAAHERSSSQA